MAEWIIEPWSRSHHREGFSSGKALLDNFLHSLVRQYEKRHLGRTYVAVRPGEKQIWGYYSLASSALSFEHLPPKVAKKLPRHPIPMVRLGRLAVDQTVHGQGLGSELLMDALNKCLSFSGGLAIFGVEVDAIDEQAKGFYEKFGFAVLEDNPLHLFLTVDTIADSQGKQAEKGG